MCNFPRKILLENINGVWLNKWHFIEKTEITALRNELPISLLSDFEVFCFRGLALKTNENEIHRYENRSKHFSISDIGI